MSLDRTFPVWRYAGDIPVFRTLAGPRREQHGDVTIVHHWQPYEWRTQFHAWAGTDYTDIDLDLSSFVLLGDDESPKGAECPCGDLIGAEDVGELLDNIGGHCQARHPGALKVKWPR